MDDNCHMDDKILGMKTIPLNRNGCLDEKYLLDEK